MSSEGVIGLARMTRVAGRTFRAGPHSVLGFVDGVRLVGEDVSVHGWVCSSDHPSEPLAIRARLDGKILASGSAAGARPDLLAAGYKTGSAGFDLRFAAALRPSGVDLDVTLPATSVSTPWMRVPIDMTLTSDLLTSNDIINVYRLLFRREPESAEEIARHLAVHQTRTSFVADMLNSPETWATHTGLMGAARELASL